MHTPLDRSTAMERATFCRSIKDSGLMSTATWNAASPVAHCREPLPDDVAPLIGSLVGETYADAARHVRGMPPMVRT